MAYDLYPAVDEQYAFPPEIRQALAVSLELRNTVVPMTSAIRNNLLPAELWDGRVIANTTTDRLERYDAAVLTWYQIAELADINTSVSALQTPPGCIQSYVGAAAPSGWLLANGAAVSRTSYAALFAICGVTYGAGDTVSTFNLPNLKGRIPLGLDASQTEFNNLGKVGGEKTHLLTTAEMPAHTHATPNFLKFDLWGHYTDAAPYDIAMSQAATQFTSSAGGGAAHNVLQPYLTLNFIIKT